MPDTPAESGMDESRDDAALFGAVDSAPSEKYCPRCNTRHPSHYKLCPNDGTALVDADSLVGTALSNSYLVTRILGEGGMGRVYEARHTRLESKRFAIKTLHEEFAHHPPIVARFRREAEAAAAIESPYVLSVYDVDETPDGRLFLVSELLEGVELGAYLAQHDRLGVPLAVRIARQLCRALAAAHRAGAVHRDLKPENIFLTGDRAAPTAKVLDFGIAKFDDKTGKALTKTGMVMGTPAYMAPEQANGLRVDHRVDIYGVGAILYHALTGRPPFVAEDPGGVLIQVMTREPPAPRSLQPSIPEELDEVIRRAMAPDRDKRYQLAQELDAALAPFDVGEADLGEVGELVPMTSAPTLVRRAEDVERRAQRVERARREVDLLWMAGLAWLGLGLLAAVAGLVRIGRGGIGATLTAGQAVGLTIACALAVGVPGYLLAQRTRGRLTDEAATELADRLRRPVIAAVSVYGLATLLLRFSELVLLRGPGAAWPGWDPLLWLASAVAATLAALPDVLERRRGPAFDGLARVLERPVLGALAAMLALATVFVMVPLVRGAPSGAGAAPTAVRVMQETRALEDALAKGNLEQAASHLDALAELEGPLAPDVQNAVLELASKSALENASVADRVFETLAEDMGPGGVDLLYRLHTEKGGSKAADRATALLADEGVRARGSPAFRIAYDLNHAKGCEEVVAQLDRAASDGDQRALSELTTVASCSRADRCCLKGDARVASAVTAMKKRLE